jgi:8-oxo-dGTP diphosphatase
MSYKNPALTVDGFVVCNGELLLIRRGNDPFKDAWALPGGFVDYGENPNDAIHREIEEETGLTGLLFSQFGVYGDPLRDPRGHTVSVIYTAFIDEDKPAVIGGDDAAEARWFPFGDLPELAFDHSQIVIDAKASNLF